MWLSEPADSLRTSHLTCALLRNRCSRSSRGWPSGQTWCRGRRCCTAQQVCTGWTILFSCSCELCAVQPSSACGVSGVCSRCAPDCCTGAASMHMQPAFQRIILINFRATYLCICVSGLCCRIQPIKTAVWALQLWVAATWSKSSSWLRICTRRHTAALRGSVWQQFVSCSTDPPRTG